MKALLKIKNGPGLVYSEVPDPNVGPEDVLIKIKATSICGTDVHIYKWDEWAKNRVNKIPLIQGHEFCGEIIEKGKRVNNLKVGDFVSAESHIVDYNGEFYKSGYGHVAPETKIIGVDINGCYAQYIALPWQNARKNPKQMPLKIAVLKENFGNAVHATCKLDLTGKNVLITGCGPVGLMAIAVSKAKNARCIYASDISEYRLKKAIEMGANITINPLEENLRNIINKSSENGVDVHIEMSGNSKAFLDGVHSVRSGGDVIAFGLFPKPFSIDINNLIIFKGITVHGVVGRLMWDTWEKVDELLNKSSVDLSKIVTHEFKLSEYKKAFEIMESGNSGKVVMYT